MLDEQRPLEREAGRWEDAVGLPGRAGIVDSVVCACPYLVAAGGWRAVAVSRDHRCGAIDPPGAVAADRQKRVCLGAAHIECATYRASEELRAVPVARETDATVPPRPVVQTMPVLLDSDRARGSWPPALRGRGAQVAVVALMSVALAALVYARGIVPAADRAAQGTPGPGGSVPATAAAIVSPSPSLSVPPSPSPPAVDSPTPVLTASPSAAVTPSASPRPTPAPTPTGSTYVVRAGDTLISIAARFGTTVAELRRLNDISDPRSLRIGQVLVLP